MYTCAITTWRATLITSHGLLFVQHDVWTLKTIKINTACFKQVFLEQATLPLADCIYECSIMVWCTCVLTRYPHFYISVAFNVAFSSSHNEKRVKYTLTSWNTEASVFLANNIVQQKSNKPSSPIHLQPPCLIHYLFPVSRHVKLQEIKLGKHCAVDVFPFNSSLNHKSLPTNK